ncbi:putative necrosis-inducing factor-domain-containing protein [Rhypophila decipiens]|uniref:Necrosis-inducing factor-domain-containing protein n=1 Tax=Rhypophila decipiens TaxID=261697 RepID=A0AAN6Y5V9_9PEZI|nr:putative necrosis-inducing factor-domain-containing protein [Rhypophila decipiens]
MGFRTILTAAVLLLGSLIQAIPFDPNISRERPIEPAHNITLIKRKTVVMCGAYEYDSNFWDETSPASPLITDCQKLAEDIEGDGEWSVGQSGHMELKRHGTCAFGVSNTGSIFGFFEPYVAIGNGDIISVINKAIELYGADGVIGSWGIMFCQRKSLGLDGSWLGSPRWVIYHT